MHLRFSLRLTLGALLLWLTACQPDLDSGPLLDFVGGTRYTAYTRVINTPADTLTFKIFATTTKAEGADTAGALNLTNMRVTVTYSPRINPIDYLDVAPNPFYPYGDPTTLVVFNRNIKQKSFALQNTFSTRSTSGHETWKFESTDEDGHVSSTSFRITLRNADSTLAYHRYTIGLQAPRTFTSRSYLALLPGLTFSRYVGFPKDSQVPYSDLYPLIDLVYVSGTDNAAVLASPSVATQISSLWPTDSSTRRTTLLRTTGLNASTFAATSSTADLTAAYAAGTSAPAPRTGTLVKGNVYAFRTQDDDYGLLYVENLVTTPIPAVRLQVRITK